MTFKIGQKLAKAFGNIYANQTGDERFRNADSFEYLDILKKTRKIEAETERNKREANLNEAVANQYEEKARRAEMFNQNNAISNTGNKGMLGSGLTGFAKIRRRVLGSVGGLGVNEDQLGG